MLTVIQKASTEKHSRANKVERSHQTSMEGEYYGSTEVPFALIIFTDPGKIEVSLW